MGVVRSCGFGPLFWGGLSERSLPVRRNKAEVNERKLYGV